jgi:hypothetical protein
VFYARQFGEKFVMNLGLWLPMLGILGLLVLGLMFAFVVGCDKV